MDSHTYQGPGPLDGLRVVELAGIGPGPYAAMLLADLGADVVRVDRPEDPAKPRDVAWHRKQLLHRGRRSLAVDLQRPEGVETVLRLAARADVMIEGYRPGVAERLGIGPEACWERNAKLVYGRMTGWGQEGPWAQMAGHDIGYIAITGALHAMGRADEPPAIPLNLVGDFASGSMFLLLGVLAALYEAARSGQGQVVDAAIVDGAASLMTFIYGMAATGIWVDERGKNPLDGGRPWYEVYATADGRHMAVGAIEGKFYRELVERLGIATRDLPERHDEASWATIRKAFASAFASRSQAEWEAVFAGTDACVAPVLAMGDAPDHAHLAARSTFVEVDGIVQAAPAPRFSRTPGACRRRPPAPGEHSREVLADWGAGDADALLRDGVVAAFLSRPGPPPSSG